MNLKLLLFLVMATTNIDGKFRTSITYFILAEHKFRSFILLLIGSGTIFRGCKEVTTRGALERVKIVDIAAEKRKLVNELVDL